MGAAGLVPLDELRHTFETFGEALYNDLSFFERMLTSMTLILQRKVLQITKTWGKEPIVVSSELLTTLASAPQDTVENKTHLVYVTMGVGAILGVLGALGCPR